MKKVALDKHHRPLQDLRISVTDRCNFRCRYCMPEEIFGQDYSFLSQHKILSFDEIERLSRIFVSLGVRKIRITGGEPLLRKNLPKLIERLNKIDGVEITKNHFMGILESKIVTTDANQLDAAKKLLQDMIDEDSEILTILYGQEVSDEEISKLVEFAEESFDHLEVEVHNGNQPLYSYIFSIE